MDNLKSLYIEELQDIFDAETQVLAALPMMIVAAVHFELKRVLEEHLEETYEHLSRLTQIFSSLQTSPNKFQPCEEVMGLVAKTDRVISNAGASEVKDAALISVAQKIELYEISAYGTARSYAKRLGLDDHAKLLQKSLNEEKKADRSLTKIAEGGWFQLGVNEEAALQ